MGLTSGTAGSTSISAGEYVVGNLINVSASATVAGSSAGGSNMSMSLYGAMPLTGVTSATLGAMSSGGLSAGSFVASQGTTGLATVSSVGLSAGSIVASVGTTGLASVISNAGTAVRTALSAAAALAGTHVEATVTFASSATSTYTGWEAMNGIARTMLTASTSQSITAFTVAPTAVTGALIAGGLAAASGITGATQITNVLIAGGLAGVSALTANGSISAVTNVGTTGNPVFSIQNTGSSFTSASGNYFSCGIMATAAIPANITITSTNVTMSGTQAILQPWFALIGS